MNPLNGSDNKNQLNIPITSSETSPVSDKGLYKDFQYQISNEKNRKPNFFSDGTGYGLSVIRFALLAFGLQENDEGTEGQKNEGESG